MNEKPSWRSVVRDMWAIACLLASLVLLLGAAVEGAGGHYAEATFDLVLILLIDAAQCR